MDKVSCYVAYSTGSMISGYDALCWESPAECEAKNALSCKFNGRGPENVSACKTLDRSFQPSRH